jgi:mannose-6-phosphate isomerase-like protein (cupin superfamily)
MSIRIVRKPWGYEKIWAHTDRYVGKILHIDRGHRLSEQYHRVKDETIYVLEGVLQLELDEGDTQVIMHPGESYRIAPGRVHRFVAPKHGTDVKLFEVSTPELEDVVRIEDDYERAN